MACTPTCSGSPVSFCFFCDGQPFGNRVRQRLFAIDRLAGVERGDRHDRMRMLGDGDGDVIDVLVVEHVAIVLHGLRGVESAGPLLGPRLPAVGDDDPLDVVRLLQVADRSRCCPPCPPAPTKPTRMRSLAPITRA